MFATGLPSADVSGGNFDLKPDEALIVQVPDVPSGYSGIELMNVFGAALPYTLAQTTLNNTTAFADPDGSTYYVVSATNPGVANWLDSNGVSSGEIFARFENLPDGTDPTGLAGDDRGGAGGRCGQLSSRRHPHRQPRGICGRHVTTRSVVRLRVGRVP